MKVSTPASPKRGNVPSSRAAASPEAKLDGTKMIVALFAGYFPQRLRRFRRRHQICGSRGTGHEEALPASRLVHGTAGIRIQEGTHGVIQMPRCTVAVRRYINAGACIRSCTTPIPRRAGGFLGCSFYQYAMRSSNLGSPDAASSRKPRA
ncbi:MAG: hypothetical protein ACLR0N_07880 [Bilophila wadsworthia]